MESTSIWPEEDGVCRWCPLLCAWSTRQTRVVRRALVARARVVYRRAGPTVRRGRRGCRTMFSSSTLSKTLIRSLSLVRFGSNMTFGRERRRYRWQFPGTSPSKALRSRSARSLHSGTEYWFRCHNVFAAEDIRRHQKTILPLQKNCML